MGTAKIGDTWSHGRPNHETLLAEPSPRGSTGCHLVWLATLHHHATTSTRPWPTGWRRRRQTDHGRINEFPPPCEASLPPNNKLVVRLIRTDALDSASTLKMCAQQSALQRERWNGLAQTCRIVTHHHATCDISLIRLNVQLQFHRTAKTLTLSGNPFDTTK